MTMSYYINLEDFIVVGLYPQLGKANKTEDVTKIHIVRAYFGDLW